MEFLEKAIRRTLTGSWNFEPPKVVADTSQIKVVFFDLDDTLYQNGYQTEGKVQVALEKYAEDNLGLNGEELFNLYKEYGTALRGLLAQNLIQEEQVDAYLDAIYDFDLEDVKPEPGLRELIERVSKRRFIFTASTARHTQACLKRLGIADLFEGIIDTREVDFETKYTGKCYRKAMQIANVKLPENCMIIDDSVRNIQAARQAGWNTVLCGQFNSSNQAKELVGEYFVESIMELSEKCPFVFAPYSKRGPFAKSLQGNTSYASLSVLGQQEPACCYNGLNEPTPSKRKVIFMVGPQGAGKRAVAEHLLDNSSVDVVSVSNLLDKAKLDPKNIHRKTIIEHQKQMLDVPVAVAIELLRVELMALKQEACLVLGFPRDVGCVEGWFLHPKLESSTYVPGAIYVGCETKAALGRLQNRLKGEPLRSLEQRIETSQTSARRVYTELKSIPNLRVFEVASPTASESFKVKPEAAELLKLIM